MQSSSSFVILSTFQSQDLNSLFKFPESEHQHAELKSDLFFVSQTSESS